VKPVLLVLIRGYQRWLSPALPPMCRYEPTCSRYAYEAVERYGVVKGSWLAIRRLLRCTPWGGSGYDPVPEPKARP
jgi:putative membrane protein insertion efficiency factor